MRDGPERSSTAAAGSPAHDHAPAVEDAGGLTQGAATTPAGHAAGRARACEAAMALDVPPDASDGPNLPALPVSTALALALWTAAWIAARETAAILAVAFDISVWYPPAGISLFVMIRYGWPGAVAIFLATFLTSVRDLSVPPGAHHVAAGLAHVAAYGAAAAFYRAGQPGALLSLRPQPLLRLLAAAFVGAALASILGDLNHGIEFDGRYDPAFDRIFGWFLGDLFGVISLCPFLMFARPRPLPAGLSLRRAAAIFRAPIAALAVAVVLAVLFAIIARNAAVNFRLVTVVGLGAFSVIVAHLLSPRSSLIYLFVISMLSAVWLSTEVAPTARMEFAVQIVTFLLAAYAMLALTMDRMRARAAAVVRRLRIRDLSLQRDALDRRIRIIETEFAQLAHELKTPLGGIIGLLAITEGDVSVRPATGRDGAPDADGAQISRYFKHMRGCALYLNALVDDAFDVTRIAKTGFEPAIGEFELSETLDDLALISLSKGGAEVVFPDDAEVARLRVRTDRNRLLQILVNLLVNAVRYSDRGPPVRVRCVAGPEHVVLSVMNAASSITKAELDGYIRGGDMIAENSQGLGIGLPLVGRLCAGIGATLSTEASGGVVAISVKVPRA
jgi:signal transduction histidine kinase